MLFRGIKAIYTDRRRSILRTESVILNAGDILFDFRCIVSSYVGIIITNERNWIDSEQIIFRYSTIIIDCYITKIEKKSKIMDRKGIIIRFEGIIIRCESIIIRFELTIFILRLTIFHNACVIFNRRAIIIRFEAVIIRYGNSHSIVTNPSFSKLLRQRYTVDMSIVKPGKSCSKIECISRGLRGCSTRITRINAVKCLNFDFSLIFTT